MMYPIALYRHPDLCRQRHLRARTGQGLDGGLNRAVRAKTSRRKIAEHAQASGPAVRTRGLGQDPPCEVWPECAQGGS